MKEPEVVQAYSTEVPPENRTPSMPLVERVDDSIGEASTMVGAMLTEFIRRTLRSGVVRIDEEMHGYVAEKVDATIADRTPAMERVAAEVAESTARFAASEVAAKEVQLLEHKTEETTRGLAGQIQETEQRVLQNAADTAKGLAGQIEQAEQRVHQATAATAQVLTGQIQDVDQRAQQKTTETAQQLTSRIEETDRKVGETAQQLGQQMEDILTRSRRGAAAFKVRLKSLEAVATRLGEQIQREHAERKTDLNRALEELQQMRTANEALTARVVELEKPRGLRALWAKLFRRGRK
jgi:hypothetical protein